MEQSIGKYLTVKKLDPNPNPAGKTCVWAVTNTSGSHLGMIHWYTPWRCYVFCPEEATLFFNADCLRDIATFMADNRGTREASDAS